MKWAVSLVIADDHFIFIGGSSCTGMYGLTYSLNYIEGINGRNMRVGINEYGDFVTQTGSQQRPTRFPFGRLLTDGLVLQSGSWI